MRVKPREYREMALRARTFLTDVPLHDVTASRHRDGGEGRTLRDIEPTFPRSAAWVRRNPVRVLPI